MIERTLGAVAAVLTIATGGFLIYDRFRSENAASKSNQAAPLVVAPVEAPSASQVTTGAAEKTALPAGAAGDASSGAAPKEKSAPVANQPGSKIQQVFLCDGQQSVVFAPGRNPNPALERFKNVPPTAEAIFDFSESRQSGTGEVLVHGQGSEWSAYLVGVELAGRRRLYGATGKNAQPNGLNFLERGEVNFETLEWTSTRLVRMGTQRGGQAEVKIAGKCSVLESPKPKPSDAPSQWQIEARFIPMPR